MLTFSDLNNREGVLVLLTDIISNIDCCPELDLEPVNLIRNQPVVKNVGVYQMCGFRCRASCALAVLSFNFTVCLFVVCTAQLVD